MVENCVSIQRVAAQSTGVPLGRSDLLLFGIAQVPSLPPPQQRVQDNPGERPKALPSVRNIQPLRPGARGSYVASVATNGNCPIAVVKSGNFVVKQLERLIVILVSTLLPRLVLFLLLV